MITHFILCCQIKIGVSKCQWTNPMWCKLGKIHWRKTPIGWKATDHACPPSWLRCSLHSLSSNNTGDEKNLRLSSISLLRHSLLYVLHISCQLRINSGVICQKNKLFWSINHIRTQCLHIYWISSNQLPIQHPPAYLARPWCRRAGGWTRRRRRCRRRRRRGGSLNSGGGRFGRRRSWRGRARWPSAPARRTTSPALTQGPPRGWGGCCKTRKSRNGIKLPLISTLGRTI